MEKSSCNPKLLSALQRCQKNVCFNLGGVKQSTKKKISQSVILCLYIQRIVLRAGIHPTYAMRIFHFCLALVSTFFKRSDIRVSSNSIFGMLFFFASSCAPTLHFWCHPFCSVVHNKKQPKVSFSFGKLFLSQISIYSFERNYREHVVGSCSNFMGKVSNFADWQWDVVRIALPGLVVNL